MVDKRVQDLIHWLTDIIEMSALAGVDIHNETVENWNELAQKCAVNPYAPLGKMLRVVLTAWETRNQLMDGKRPKEIFLFLEEMSAKETGYYLHPLFEEIFVWMDIYVEKPVDAEVMEPPKPLGLLEMIH
jgi:hypothetical protein